MLGLLYDVHGNLPALEAVLQDAAGHGVERFFLGGDYALFGAWPRDTIERLRGLDAVWIRGNGERWTADPGSAPESDEVRGAIEICRTLLGDESVAELAALEQVKEIDGTLLCHGSPVSDVRGFMGEPLPEDEELLAGVAAERVVAGHTHIQFVRRTRGGIELVNPGSVGMPLDGDTRAAYAIVQADGRIEPRRVPYDSAASAAAVRERLGRHGETPARRIESARF